MHDILIKRGDQLPAIQSVLSDSTGVVDLTNATVDFIWKLRNVTGHVPKTGSATVVDETNGIVKYSWAANDVSGAGMFNAEWQVTFSDNRTMTFPNNGYFLFEIMQDLT